MSTPAPIKITEEGLLLPRQMYEDLGEIEVVRRPDYILIKSKSTCDRDRRDRVRQILREAGLLVEVHGERPPEVSPKERAELAKKLSVGRPLSEIVIEEREERW
ncbi:MAG: hypothetical protein ACETWB_04135 [Anaerolineae bacterium]